MEQRGSSTEHTIYSKRLRFIRLFLLKCGLAIGALVLIFGPGLLGHIRNAANPFVFTEDVRIHIWPFLRYQDPALFPGDYTCQYLLDCAPAGHRALFRAWALRFDIRTLSKALPYVLLGIVLLCVTFATKRLGGGPAAWCAVALCLASDVFMARMTGGLPRAFAYPLISIATAALVVGRPHWLIAAALLGAALYPVVAVVAGLSLAAYLLLMPASDRGGAGAWSLRKRLTVVMLTGVGAALVVSVTAIPCSRYGALLGAADVRQYPESGPGGRWDTDSRAPYPGFLAGSAKEAWRFFADPDREWIMEVDAKLRAGGMGRWIQLDVVGLMILVGAIGVTTAVGFAGLLRADPAARRLTTLLVGTFAGYIAASQLAPVLFLPQRYLAYTIPILAAVAFPSAISWLASHGKVLSRGRWSRAVLVVLVSGACIVFLGRRDSAWRGYSVNASHEAQLYSFFGSLPADSLIAGWPDGVIQSVPYLSDRPVFVSRETHLVFHRGFVEEMRRRTRALVDAYFASNADPLIRLRDEFGVTHLVIDKHHYSRTRASYFRPFDTWVAKAYADLGDTEPEALRQAQAAAVFEHGPLSVIDLKRLRGVPSSHEFSNERH